LEVDPKMALLYENLFGDPHRYEQIMMNFVSNALKFTGNNGTVKIIL